MVVAEKQIQQLHTDDLLAASLHCQSMVSTKVGTGKSTSQLRIQVENAINTKKGTVAKYLADVDTR